jgi:hypothetical protein
MPHANISTGTDRRNLFRRLPKNVRNLRALPEHLRSASGSESRGGASMKSVHRAEKTSMAELFGIIVGGGALVAVLSGQIFFVAWATGFGW